MLKANRSSSMHIPISLNAGIILLFLILPFLCFWRNFPLLAKENILFFDDDFLGGFFPVWWHGSQILNRWQDLLWDPTQSCGLPFISLPHIGIFYLPKFLMFLIANVLNLQGNILFLAEYLPMFHLSLAGIFTYLFLRRIVNLDRFASLFGGLVFMFNASFIHHLVYPDNVISVTWLPLLLFCYIRSLQKMSYKWAAGTGVIFALSLLAGYPHGAIINGLFLFTYLLFHIVTNFKKLKKKEIIRYLFITGVVMALGFCISAVQLLPTLEAARNSTEIRIRMNPEQASEFAFHPFHLIYFFVPNFFEQRLAVYGYNYNYIGILPFLLVVLSIFFCNKNSYFKFFLIAAITFLLLSFGLHTFLHKLLYLFVPGFSTFRRPAFFHYLVAFALSGMAAMGLAAISTNMKTGRRRVLQSLLKFLAVSFIALIFFSLSWYFRLIIHIAQNRNDNIVLTYVSLNHFNLFLIFFSISTMIIWFIARKKGVLNYKFKALIIAFVLVDLFSVAQKYAGINDPLDPRKFYAKNKITEFLSDEGKKEKFRTMFLDLPYTYNSSMYAIEQWGGYQGLAQGRYFLFSDAFLNSSDSEIKIRGYGLANIRYLVSPVELNTDAYKKFRLYKQFIVSKNDKDVYVKVVNRGIIMQPGESIYMYLNQDCFPRTFVLNKVEIVGDSSQVLDKMKNVDLRNIAVIAESDLPDNKQKTELLKLGLKDELGATAKILNYKNSTVEIEANMPGRGLLVLSDIYYPGWEVFVDGKKGKILKVDYMFRGVLLEKGKHRIRFSYEPQSLKKGALISLLGVIGCIVLLLFKRKVSSYSLGKR